MREKLIELLGDKLIFGRGILYEVADHLIANGVTIPVRCKDCVYNENGCCTHSEYYDDTRYRPDYFCADGERRTDDQRTG